MRVVAIIIDVVLVGFDRQLVHIRLANRSNHMPDIKVMIDEIFFQISKQFGDARWVSSPDIIDGLNKPFAEHVSPHAVDEALGKVRVLFARYP